jgi:methionyl-tRNA synthetase
VSETSTGVTVITIPPPTANGPLHVGHLSGPYLAADIAARAARGRGERVLAVAGIDVGQNYIATMAQIEGRDVHQMMAHHRAEILEAFDRGRIHYDTFIDPQLPSYVEAISGMVSRMVERGALVLREMTLHACTSCGRTLHHSYVAGSCACCGTGASGGSCEGCGGFTSAETLKSPMCDRCGGLPRPMSATVPVLRLEDYRERLVAMWLRAELPSRVRDSICYYLSAGLPEIPIAYPTD